MASTWYFRPKRPGEPNREPVFGEFFAADAVGDPATALVREGIQNSLDAGTGDGPVLVRIHLSGGVAAVPPEDQEEWFAGAWEHHSVSEKGPRAAAALPAERDPCPFLLFEDFSTCGLEGDPSAPFQPRDGRKNDFFHFFRAEGLRDEEPSDRGSWGVGKYVFFKASRISTVFGLTRRRSDGRRLLMGKSVLRSHYVGDRYFQDGYFGRRALGGDELVLPEEDPSDLDRFTHLFSLERQGSDDGLSVVVPWPREEIRGDALVRAVVRQYFFPILQGRLEVWVRTPSVEETSLDRDSFLAQTKHLDPESGALVELAAWGIGLADSDFRVCRMPEKRQPWKWSPSLFGRQQLADLRECLNGGRRVALRVPVTVRKRTGELLSSCFSVYFERDKDVGRQRPTFVRDGIVVSDVRGRTTRNVRSIVVAEAGPLAEFLRHAENPSHTEWGGARLKDEYARGCVTDLRFVTDSVQQIVEILVESDQEEDSTVLEDVFFLRSRDGDRGPGGGPGPDLPGLPATSFRVVQRSGGFAILPGSEPLPSVLLRVRVSYDVRRGDPLRRYRTSDFRLDEEPIIVEVRNGRILRIRDNFVEVELLGPDFSVEVTGFDEKRQLYVKVIEEPRIAD